MLFSITRVSRGRGWIWIFANDRLATLYKSLGIGSHTILALAAVYGTVAFISNSLTTKYMTDQWGRRK